MFLVKFKKNCLENFTKTVSKHVFLEEEGRNTTPLKTPSWTAEVIFTAQVRPKCYKGQSVAVEKKKKRGLKVFLNTCKR